MWIVWVILAIFAVGIVYALMSTKKMVDAGELVARKSNFMENAEIFTLRSVDPAEITEGLKAFNYAKMHVSLKGSSENQAFRFSCGNSWEAQLCRESDDGTMMVYRFEFTSWENRNGRARGSQNMNMLETAVEKLFLRLDERTQVQTQPLQLNVKHR